MKKNFSSTIFGYKKGDVEKKFETITLEHKHLVSRKDEEIAELTEEVRILKKNNILLKIDSDEYKDKKDVLTNLIATANDKKESIIKDAKKEAAQLIEKAKTEGDLYLQRNNDIRTEVIEINNKIGDILDKLQLDIGFLLEKEIAVLDENDKISKKSYKKSKKERKRYLKKNNVLRKEIVDFDNELYEILEKIHSEVNYLLSKEYSENLIVSETPED